MQLVQQTLSRGLQPSRPYLFYGPSNSGKKTILKAALQSMKIRPVVLSLDEAQSTTLNPIDLFGRIGFIVYIDSLTLLPRDPQLIVLYVTLDPYSWSSADQLQAKFTLVDLSKVLRNANAVDNELVKVPPWELFRKLASSGRSAMGYDQKLVLIERSPMFTQTLHNNVFGITHNQKNQELSTVPHLQVEPIANCLDKLSELDRSFYIEHSGEHANLLENMAMIRRLRLNGSERLDWTKKPKQNRFNKVDTKKRVAIDQALYKYSALLPKPELTTPDKRAGSVAPSAPDKVKAPRRAPQCKLCGVPMKGHKCPKKPPKP